MRHPSFFGSVKCLPQNRPQPRALARTEQRNAGFGIGSKSAGLALAVMPLVLGGCGLVDTGSAASRAGTTFTVQIANVSEESTLSPSDGTTVEVLLSPGVWVVYTKPAPMFAEGEVDAGDGLEALAEDGDPVPFASYASALTDQDGVESSGVFDTPDGLENPSALRPGEAYKFKITATPGASLSFATMFAPSNDLFFAPGDEGIALFHAGGTPVEGDVTAQVMLWDAGTEVNQEPGVGPDQVERQENPDTGEEENGVVGLVDDEFAYPEVGDVIVVNITPEAEETDPVREGLRDLGSLILQNLLADLVYNSFNVPTSSF